jgi:SOS-response transcriptional repressor LexA
MRLHNNKRTNAEATALSRDILRYLADGWRACDPRTFEDVMQRFRLNSKSHVRLYVRRLQRDGLLDVVSHRPRNMRLTEAGWREVGFDWDSIVNG